MYLTIKHNLLSYIFNAFIIGLIYQLISFIILTVLFNAFMKEINAINQLNVKIHFNYKMNINTNKDLY